MNPYELQRRAEKAFRLATHLHKHHITADECAKIQPGEWVSLAHTLRLNPPSDLTQAEAVRMLRDMEAVAV